MNNELLDKRTKCSILLVFDMNGFEYTGPFSERLLFKDDFLFTSRNLVSFALALLLTMHVHHNYNFNQNIAINEWIEKGGSLVQ